MVADVTQHNMMGYMVVRKPQFTADSPRSRGVVSHPELGNVHYCGVDRMPWHEIAQEFYSGLLPEHLRNAFESILDSQNDFGGLALCRSESESLAFLEYSNHKERQSELIGLHSNQFPFVAETTVTRGISLGFDYLCLSEWSILRAGLFEAPNAFTEWVGKINVHGLFGSTDAISKYSARYVEVSIAGLVEPLSENPLGFAAVEIFSIVNSSI
ncbi:MAG: hypothetical protein KA401_03510 [Anaerolineae bacterium]|nr:hypothetical protein [Anaerolineae bacterium]